MEKNKRLIVIAFLLLLSLGGLVTSNLLRSQSNQGTSQSSEEWAYTTFDGKISNYAKLSDDLLLVDGAFFTNTSISKQYVTDISSKIADKTYETGRYHSDDFVKLNIYNTDYKFGKAHVRTLDLKQKLADYNDNYLYAGSIITIHQDERTGDYILIILAIPKDKPIKEGVSPSNLYKHSQKLYFNLRTETFQKHIKWSNPSKSVSNLGNIFSSEVTNLNELNDNNSSIYVSDTYVGLRTNYKQMKLYKKYSLKKHGVTETYRLYWYGEPNSKELAELLAPEGQTDIFQGVTLYGAYSKDGQDHVVQSYDELMQWYQEPATDNSQSSQAN